MPNDVVLAVEDVELIVDLDLGARATSWTVDGLSLLAVRGEDPVEFGMYPMAPWAGRTRGNQVTTTGGTHVLPTSYDGWALHGTVLASRLEIVEHRQSKDTATLVARAAKNVGWPWPAEVDVSWQLASRVLTTMITVRAPVEQFPVVVGWHPWFARTLHRGGALEWDMDAAARAVRGPDHLPNGAFVPFDRADGPFDDAFLVPDGHARVRWPGALALDIISDAPWFVVYDQLPDTACVEPQSGPPNGINDGLGRPIPIAAPGRAHQLTTRWLMRDEQPED